MRRQDIRMRWTKLLWIALLAAWVLIPSTALSKGVVCRASGIEGYELHALRAHDYVRNITEDPAQAIVYITRSGPNEFYLHSNFLSAGAENPTKVLIKDEQVDLESLTRNIIYTSEEDFSFDFPREIFSKIKFVVDRDTLENASDLGWLRLDSTERLYVSNGPESSVKVAHIRTAKGIQFIEHVEGAVYRRLKSGTSFRNFREIPFRKSDVAVLPLVTNEATIAAISKKLPPENVLPLDPQMSAAELFRRYQDKTLILLGHIESGAFVTYDARGKEIYRLAIDNAKREAEANRVTLVTLGCNSAAHADLGVAKEFNTLDAVDRLAQALEAYDFQNFFRRLSAEELPFVIDEQAIHVKAVPETAEQSTRHEIEITVYNHELERAIGKISLVSVRLSPNLSTPNTSDQNSAFGSILGEPEPPRGPNEPERGDEGFPWGAFLPVLAIVGGGGFWLYSRRRRTT